MSSPRTLILNQPFDSNTGGGITLSNLFANWEKDKLAVACSGYLITDETDFDLCDKYYQLGSKEHRWIFPFNLFSRKYYSGPLMPAKPSNGTKKNVVVKKSKLRDKLILNYMHPILDYFGFSHFVLRAKLSPEFCKWVEEFDPQVIYIQATTRAELLFCLQLKEQFNIPMVFHMMDDWPTMVGTTGLGSKFWERKINTELKLLLDQTDIALSISDYMAEEYQRRYDKVFTTFHNPLQLDFWKKAQRSEYHLQDEPILLYAGRVGLGIEDSLKNIAKAIEKVNASININMKFVLQVKDEPSWAKDFTCVKHSSFVDYEELPRVFAESDFLILPYDFNDEGLSFIKYSMPTKAPEYMVSGTPIIIFAPEDTALIKYAKKGGWAEVVTDNNIDMLTNSIKDLVTNESKRKSYGQKAIHIAEKNHNLKTVSNHFKKVISSTIT